jgi:hypothetical protein
MIHQKRDFFKTSGNPHIWLYGNPGTGKSALMQVIYPDYFNKNLDTKFFDRYDDKTHSHVLLQDVDHVSFEKLGVQFFKSICDEAGYPIDQKYKTPQIVRLCVLITSNFQIHDVVPEDMKGRRENLQALHQSLGSNFFRNMKSTNLRRTGTKILARCSCPGIISVTVLRENLLRTLRTTKKLFAPSSTSNFSLRCLSA